MPYSKQDLQNLYSLSFEDVNATLAACGLSLQQDEYADEQIQSGFDVIRKYFTDAQVTDYAAAAEIFSQQSLPKTKKTGRGKKLSNSLEQDSSIAMVEENDLDISQLLAQATSQCGTRISVSEAGKILSACGLPDKEQYTGFEGEVFVEACTLIKQENKTYEEMAAHFGIAQQSKSNAHGMLLDEVRQLLSQPAFSQAEQIREALPQMAIEQLEEIKALFWQMTAQRLRQYVDSGQLEAEIRQASKSVLVQRG
jgi:hypothetical protein